jgi:hypothetical protein
MLREEAQWLADKLYLSDGEKVFPLLNIGSASAHFREKEKLSDG